MSSGFIPPPPLEAAFAHIEGGAIAYFEKD